MYLLLSFRLNIDVKILCPRSYEELCDHKTHLIRDGYVTDISVNMVGGKGHKRRIENKKAESL